MQVNPHDQSLPKVRDEIIFSPGKVEGERIVYYVYDGCTNQFFRIGEKEHFVLTKLDGRTTLEKITEAYELRFHRRLAPQSWDGLFKLLNERQMLESTAAPVKLEELSKTANLKRQENQRWFYKKFHLANPDAFLTRLLPYLRFMFRPQVVISMLGLIVCLEIWIGFNLKIIYGQAGGGSKVMSGWFLFMGTLLVATLCHELAHALACKYFGGRVTDMGIMWRYLWFYPYCNLDHTMFFRNRWHQVFVAFAGIYMNLLTLFPFALVWSLTPPGTLLHTLSIKMLLWFNVMTFLNLIPFIQLDGYYMLSHALGMSELRKESHRYLWKAVKRIIRKSDGQAGRYRPMTKFIYSVYGVLSLLMTGSLMLMMLSFWYRILAARFASSNFMLAGIFIMIIAARYGVRVVIKINQRWRDQAIPLTER